MLDLSAGIGGPASLEDREFSAFQRLFAQLAGIELAESKRQLVFGRLRSRLRQLNLHDFADYVALLGARAQHEERQLFVDLLTTNETYFFREPRHFELLRQEILPAQPPARPFRVWSAASSSGEEAYSIAMVMADLWGLRSTAAWEVLGSDISQRVLAKARSGHYPLLRVEGIPPHCLQQYCLKGTGNQNGTMLIEEALRSRVSFRQVNLNERLPDLGRFDVVFLRNMLIYFQPQAKAEIVRRVLDVILPGGWLIVGHSESLKSVDPRLQVHSPSVYRVSS